MLLIDINKLLSIVRRYVSLIVRINEPAARSLITLYNVTIILLLGVLVLSIVSLSLFTLQLINNSFNSILDNIILKIMGDPKDNMEILSRGELLGFMISSISIIVGFYGIISQLYAGEWSPTILLRRIFIMINTGAKKKRAKSDNNFVVEYVNSILDILFPDKRSYIVITYDQAIILVLLLALFHLMTTIIVGNNMMLPINIILFIFTLLLASSVTLTWLSTMIRPPLSVQISMLTINGPLRHVNTRISIPAAFGLSSLTDTGNNMIRTFTRLIFIVYIFVGIILYMSSPPSASLYTDFYSDNGYVNYVDLNKVIIFVSMHVVTILTTAILLGLKYFNRAIARLSDYGNKVIYISAVASVILYFIIMLILWSKIGVGRRDFMGLVGGFILLASASVVGFTLRVVSARGAVGFWHYVNYADMLLDMLRRGPAGSGPSGPQVVNELLAAETMLSMMVTATASYKRLEEQELRNRVAVFPEYVESRMGVRIVESSVPLVMANPSEYPSRFFVSIEEVDKYFVHVESLASAVRGMLASQERGQAARELNEFLIRSIIVAGQGLLAARLIGRTGAHSYPRALLEVVRVLMTVKKYGYMVNEELLGEIEAILPDLLVEFMEISSMFKGSICSQDVGIDLSICIEEAANDKHRSYCCLLAHILIGDCVRELGDDPAVRRVAASCGLIEARRPMGEKELARLCKGRELGGGSPPSLEECNLGI